MHVGFSISFMMIPPGEWHFIIIAYIYSNLLNLYFRGAVSTNFLIRLVQIQMNALVVSVLCLSLLHCKWSPLQGISHFLDKIFFPQDCVGWYSLFTFSLALYEMIWIHYIFTGILPRPTGLETDCLMHEES